MEIIIESHTVYKPHPKVRYANYSVWKAIGRGIIKQKEYCSICGQKNPIAHHENYDKPFEIIWLCRKCHKARHKEINNGKPVYPYTKYILQYVSDTEWISRINSQ